MFVEFTEQEKAEILAIEEKYENAFKALEELMEKLNPTPNTEYLFEGINAKDNPEEWEAAIKKENEILDAWEAKGSPEWKAAREKWHELSSSYNKERAELFKRAERRQFNEFNGDLNNILEDAKNQTIRLIYELYQFFNNGTDSKVLLDGEDVKKRIQGSLRLHIEALKGEPKLYKEFNAYVDNTIKRSEYIAPKGTKQEDITKIPEAVVEELGQYMKLPQDNHTNHLAHKLTTKIKGPAQLDLTGKATITSQDFRLYIEGYDKLVNGANTSAVKFFDAAVITCSRDRDPLARIPLKEYMELRGLKDEKEARKQIKADMEVLKAVKFEYKGTGKSRGDWLSLSLYGGRAGIYRGVIEFRFTPEFYASIPENQFMFIPKEYFSTRDKYNPHTAYFIRKIAEHKRMNLGKPNENIIGVETLISSSPTFPKYDETKGYHFSQLILQPFERDMDAIQSIKWHYAGEQPTNYTEFITSNVVITCVDYPDVAKLTQRKKHSIKEKNTLKKGG